MIIISKFFDYKVNLLGNIWRSLEMPLMNCKVELKLKWTNYYLLSAAGNENVNNIDSNNIIFTMKDTTLYLLVVTLSARDIQKQLKLLSKGFERSVYWNEYKRKKKIKNTTNKYRYFLKSNFVGVNTVFVLVYTNQGVNAKRFNAQKYLAKGIIKNYNISSMEKNFYDQAIDSDIKRYEKIRK